MRQTYASFPLLFVTLAGILLGIQRSQLIRSNFIANRVYVDVVQTSTISWRMPICAFDIFNFPSEGALGNERARPLKIEDRSSVAFVYEEYRAGQEMAALDNIEDYFSAGHQDSMAWLLMAHLRQDLFEKGELQDSEYQLPTWWKGGKSFFLWQGWCWASQNEFNQATAYLELYSQAAVNNTDISYRNIEKSRNLYAQLETRCQIEDHKCLFWSQVTQQSLIQLYELATQSDLPQVRAEAYFSLAQLELKNNGISSQLIEWYKLALVNDPASVTYHTHLGSAFVGVSQYDEAEQQLSLALQYANSISEKAFVLGQIGYLNLARDSYLDAAENFESSIQLDNRDKSYQIGLARAYLELDRPADAIQKLLNVVAAEPQRSEAWGYLGIAYRQQNLLDQAIEAFFQSLSIAPFQSAFRLDLAQTLLDAGRKAEAIEQYAIILEQEPSRNDIAELITQLRK
ncbi:MAG: tetratricopeptide repeat protein [Chloroflexi bacterium]|nr:tetratricopeptide repeat protein [Chloroflexota bacterium]